MTDRFNALTVVLEKDMRDDDSEMLLNAIRQLRGVLSVTGNVESIMDAVAQERVRSELSNKLWAVLK